MLRIEFRVMARALSAAQMAAAEDWLIRAGWRSAARAAAQAFAATGPEVAGGPPPLRPRGGVAGGIYFAPAAAEPAPSAEWFYALAKAPGPRPEPELEVGRISPAAPVAGAPPGAALGVWMAAWSAALAAVAGEAGSNWRDPGQPVRLAPLLASGAYQQPRLRLAELEQAAVLAEPGPREWFERLRRAGQMRAADLAREPEAARAAMRRLTAVGLAAAVGAESAGANSRVTGWAYAPEEGAAAAARDWPALWLTERLSALGCGAIVWPRACGADGASGGLSPAGEGMPRHVVAEFCGQRWCLICMEGAWNQLAARAWEDWRAAWGAGPLVVIALGGLAAPLPPEAAAAAGELASGAAALRAAFAPAARQYAAQRLAPLEEAYGWPLAAILEKRFG